MDRDPTRERMIQEHESLREDLARLERSASEFRREGLYLLGPLREQAESFLAKLRKHAAWEQSLLPSHGESGANRALEDERRVRAHREQCELLDTLVDDLRDGSRPPTIIAAHTAAVAGLVLRDFVEEGEVLSVPRPHLAPPGP